MSIGASEHRAFVRAKARFAGQKAQEHISSVEMLLHRTYCVHRWWHFLAESAARALPFPTSQRPTCPLSFTPGGTPPARPSAASVAAGCEPFSAFPLLPGPSTCHARPFAAPVASRCEPFSPNRLTPAPPSRTSPASLVAKLSPNHGPVLGRDCRREFRQARSRAPLPDSVMTVVGMTDGVWQGGSVTRILL